jgi:hypothetical protein
MGRGKRCSRRASPTPAFFYVRITLLGAPTQLGVPCLPGGADLQIGFLLKFTSYAVRHSPFDSLRSLRAGRTPQQKPIWRSAPPGKAYV